MFERIVLWAGIKVARAALCGGRALSAAMHKDADRLSREGQYARAGAIRDLALELDMTLKNGADELATC